MRAIGLGLGIITLALAAVPARLAAQEASPAERLEAAILDEERGGDAAAAARTYAAVAADPAAAPALAAEALLRLGACREKEDALEAARLAYAAIGKLASAPEGRKVEAAARLAALEERAVREEILRTGEIPVEGTVPGDVRLAHVDIRATLAARLPGAGHLDGAEAAATGGPPDAGVYTLSESWIHSEEGRALLGPGEWELSFGELTAHYQRSSADLDRWPWRAPGAVGQLFLEPVSAEERALALRAAPDGDKPGARARALFQLVARESGAASAEARAERLARLLRGAGIPARVALGLYFTGSKLVRHAWVYFGLNLDAGPAESLQWYFADPERGFFLDHPANYVCLGFERLAPDRAARLSEKALASFGTTFEEFARQVRRVPFQLLYCAEHAETDGERSRWIYGRPIFEADGRLDGRTYRNFALGFSCDIPEGFEVYYGTSIFAFETLETTEEYPRAAIYYDRLEGRIAADADALERAVDRWPTGGIVHGINPKFAAAPASRRARLLGGAPAVEVVVTGTMDLPGRGPSTLRVRSVFFLRKGRLLNFELVTWNGAREAAADRAFERLLESVR
jgi:hypothetical protein